MCIDCPFPCPPAVILKLLLINLLINHAELLLQTINFGIHLCNIRATDLHPPHPLVERLLVGNRNAY